MKTVKYFITLIAFVAFTFSLSAQDNPPTFFVVDYMKATPGKETEYVNAESDTWKRIHQERKKLGLLTAWFLYGVRSPSGTASEYDYVTVSVIQGWNKMENPWGDLFTGGAAKFLTKEQLAVFNATTPLRNLVRTEIYYGEDFVASPLASTTVPSKYEMINFMKVNDGMWDEYVNMETKIVKPVHVEMMKTGGRSAWGLYSLVLPGGSSQPYDAVAIDFYGKWTDMGPGGDFSKALKAVHPGMSEAYFERRIEETRKLVKRELWEVLSYVQ